tara:strand:- start:854 stop:1042 length:189 start_codon:yes stop_codon:yes gene_type:complete
MSYHGFPPPDYNQVGIAVVNPLHRIEQKLKKIKETLDGVTDESTISVNDLKIMIGEIIEDNE